VDFREHHQRGGKETGREGGVKMTGSAKQIQKFAQRLTRQPGRLQEGSRGVRSVATTPPVSEEVETTLKGSQRWTGFARGFLHPFRVRDFVGRFPGGIAALNPLLPSGIAPRCLESGEGSVSCMKYQLALQFPESLIADYDEMIALEDELLEKLGSSAKVDGHDCGSVEMNIFIHTDEPMKVFETIRPVVAKRKLIENLVAAYRERTGEEYTIVWPIGFTKQFRIS
jgi:hypothetical protein